MQYEGEHRQIVLRGIERAMANGVAQDGGVNEVINLIPRNGSLVPYAPKDVTDDCTPFLIDNREKAKMVRVHHTSTGDNTIIVFEDHYYVNPTQESQIPISKTVKNIVFIGNRMDLETSAGIEHWLWKNGAYVNNDDLNAHSGSQSQLPSVSFKVERGIYDGSKTYKSARYVKVHKAFTDADTAKCNQEELTKYVRESGSVGSDAMALIDSIRHMGGITGYVLVSAAWRMKGGDVTNPKYIMASPVLLMGAPEIYMKDNSFEEYLQNGSYVDKSTLHGAVHQKTFLLDMFDYDCPDSGAIDSSDFNKQKEALDYLWNLSDSDDRDMEDLSEQEHAFIETIEEASPCYLRQFTTDIHREWREQRSVAAGQGDDAVWVFTEKKHITQLPALCSRKYAVYNHGTRNGANSNEAEYRGYRITQGSANILSFKLNSELQNIYKDEIDRLCIFVSPVVSPYKHSDTSGVRFESDYIEERIDEYDGFFFGNERTGAAFNIFYSACGGSFSPVMKSAQEIRDELKNVAGLYKVAEVQLNELTEGADANGWVKVNLSEGRLATDRMVQHSDTMLKLSDLQPVGFTKGQIFGYNERLHVFNFQKNEVYRLPYESLCYYGGAGQYKLSDLSTDWKYQIEVNDSKDSIIINKLTNMTAGLNPLVSCSDLDAKYIRVLKYKETAMSFPPPGVAGEVTKAPLEIAGIVAGYVSEDLAPIELATESYQDIVTLFHSEDIKPDSYAWGKNEIRVSNTGTTIFEVDKSYKIGHGEIIALARLSMGLSQDNYSKFPLVVFCNDGVYTLSVDASGQYAYHSQDPLSRAVCTNKNGICEIDGAVLFPTEFGLQMVTSDGVKPVALAAIGKPICSPDSVTIYNRAITNSQIVELKPNVSTTDFLSDIQDDDTYIKYLQAINSVIVYNKTKAYSYIINISDWTVTKIEHKILCDNGDYPKQTFFVDGNAINPVQFDYYSGKNNSMTLIASRPIMLETQHLKTGYRVVLRGVFEHNPVAQEEFYAAMCVFGSLDGEHWDFLNATEKKLTSNRFHDIGVETHHVSYKYLMVILAGNLSKDCHIEGLEITSNVKYNNKLK